MVWKHVRYTHCRVLYLLYGWCDKHPDLLVHEPVLRRPAHDVFSGRTRAVSTWEERLPCTYERW